MMTHPLISFEPTVFVATLANHGSAGGMLAANAPVVFLGRAFSGRLPMCAIQ